MKATPSGADINYHNALFNAMHLNTCLLPVGSEGERGVADRILQGKISPCLLPVGSEGEREALASRSESATTLTVGGLCGSLGQVLVL